MADLDNENMDWFWPVGVDPGHSVLYTAKRALMKKYAENSLEVLTASADMATMEAKSLFELEASSKEPLASATAVAVETDSHEPRSYTPQPQASCATQEPQADASNGQSEDLIHVSPFVDHNAQHTKKLFELARKKFSGDLDEQDREAISTMFTNGDSIEQRLDDYVLELLSRETLTLTETELLKLLLSKIVNLLDSTMQSVIQNLLTPSQLDFVCGQSCTKCLASW
ncbi:hypothetical protein DM01DRAFT_1216216 [Hesseltinella vesiculosa]|uniref:Uncharacterized protein n=1 Tax=Hesseltinella vesiculosa TaxID=101127 RepID=A0A1X2GPU7_9FUNG|nr:hypothetical protein DM01DRAFT_1216216 [Hesseltinella vesiculosa]